VERGDEREGLESNQHPGDREPDLDLAISTILNLE
jgi:hypothetical protein